MNQCQAAIVALLLTATAAMPCAAQQARSNPHAIPSEICAACFTYLVFSQSLEPESYATRGDATESFISLSAEPSDPAREQTGGVALASTQEARIVGSRHQHK